MPEQLNDLFRISESDPDLALILATVQQADDIYRAAMAAMEPSPDIPAIKNSADVVLSFHPVRFNAAIFDRV